MDPNATWKQLGEHFDAEDYLEARELAGSLLHWIWNGGFIPTVTGSPKADRFIVATFCKYVIRLTNR